ncbi:IQUB, partial [Symbiodinium pilosum]
LSLPSAAAGTSSSTASQDKAYERLSLEHQHLLWLLERAAVGSASSLAAPPNMTESGAAAFLRRLGDLAMAERSSLPSAAAPPAPAKRSSISKDQPPTTPEKRHSILDDLSDLGNPSEAGDVASDAGVEDGNEAAS